MIEIEKEIDRVLKQYPNEITLSKKELNPLIKLLSSDANFDIFNDHCHCLGASTGICFNHEEEFPKQIILRAKEIGTKQTINEIQSYISSSHIEMECALLLYNIQVDTEYTFSNGVKIINFYNLKDLKLVNFLSKEEMTMGGINTSLLVIDYITKKEFFNSISSKKMKSDWSKIKTKIELIQKLNETRFILSLGRHHSYGIPVVGSFEIVPDNLKFLNNGISFGPFSEPRTAFGPPIIELELRNANDLLENFELLSVEDKEKIKVALKRLNEAKIDPDWANKCINLRICLENLFCQKDDKYIKDTIAERAPNYLNFTKTRTKNIYKYLSTAVHTGVPGKHPEIKEKDIIREIHKTIIQYIKNGGYPKWPQKKK
ncbi:MAG: hypothetical protein R3A45_11535 [Bdellovibrionota bacterium]